MVAILLGMYVGFYFDDLGNFSVSKSINMSDDDVAFIYGTPRKLLEA
jgi:hypothetical protein